MTASDLFLLFTMMAIYPRSRPALKCSQEAAPFTTTTTMVEILTANEILRKGLELVGFDWHRQRNVSRPTNLQRFRAHYGSNPVVYAQIWEDLQTTAIPEARIDTKIADSDNFLMAIRFLKGYPTESEQAGIFKLCEKVVRKWTWYYACKVQALKGQKVSLLLTALV